MGKWIEIWKGVREGCVSSPDLFNIYSEEILDKINTCDGLKLGTKNYNNLRKKDDITLMADSEEKLQELVNFVSVESEKLGLSINCQKAFSMICTKKKQIPTCCLKFDKDIIEQKDSFKYLGS